MSYLQPLVWEIAHSPRCGLCSFFPINADAHYHCPVLDRTVYRRSKPPQVCGSKISRFYCFYPMTELAYEQLQKYQKEREQPWNAAIPKERRPRSLTRDQENIRVREQRRLNPQPHRDEVKRWRINNPEKAAALVKRYQVKNKEKIKERHHQRYVSNREEIAERSRFRSYIDYYNPMHQVNRLFWYAKIKERTGLPRQRTPRDKARRRELDRQKRQLEKDLVRIDVVIESSQKTLADLSMPEFLQEKEAKVKLVDADHLWKHHPRSYRKRGLKFKRLDMQ